MAENLDIYNAVRNVPEEAKKAIRGGRLNGKTDINPMWRIKTLTEHFGPCGIGWTYEITKQWLETGHGGEIAAFCNINLYVCVDGEWSRAIPGTGGSAFVSSESKGLYTSDECYKMALTDALSVACKALGFGADVYWEGDRTKYDKPRAAATPTNAEPAKPVDPAIMPGGERFYAAVEQHAKGCTAYGKTIRDIWANSVKATPEMLAAFDNEVANYKIEHNLQ